MTVPPWRWSVTPVLGRLSVCRPGRSRLEGPWPRSRPVAARRRGSPARRCATRPVRCSWAAVRAMRAADGLGGQGLHAGGVLELRALDRVGRARRRGTPAAASATSRRAARPASSSARPSVTSASSSSASAASAAAGLTPGGGRERRRGGLARGGHLRPGLAQVGQQPLHVADLDRRALDARLDQRSAGRRRRWPAGARRPRRRPCSAWPAARRGSPRRGSAARRPAPAALAHRRRSAWRRKRMAPS